MDCGFDGDAWASLVNGEIVWERVDERVHVTSQLLDIPSARTHFEQKYDVGPWCPATAAYHATRKDDE